MRRRHIWLALSYVLVAVVVWLVANRDRAPDHGGGPEQTITPEVSTTLVVSEFVNGQWVVTRVKITGVSTDRSTGDSPGDDFRMIMATADEPMAHIRGRVVSKVSAPPVQ